jgi:formyltetrahydrofolate-dependent phosphoribosylglycinamide formyltransferase
MANLVAACRSDYVPADPVLVVSPTLGTPAVHHAEALEVPVRIVPKTSGHYADRLLSEFKNRGVDYVCLAGYMYLLPSEVVEVYPRRILNIHPSLLPKYGGKGMYGIKVHEAVLEAGDKESGCTVHYVNENYDEGDIVIQRKCPVYESDTPESLARRVLDIEHEIYPEALAKVVRL